VPIPLKSGALALFAVVVCSPLAAEDWSRFRGNDGSGISGLEGLPTSWSDSDYAWKIELPGVGHAAPIVHGDRLFVTSAVEEGAVRSLHCLDANTGKEFWTRTIGLDRSHKHQKNSWASSTPCTDGERVYVVFADVENYTLAAYDYDGELVWRRRLGEFRSQHGQGVSPILFEDLVILTNDQRGPSSIMAFDKGTGDVRWSTLRAIREASYATPTITEVNGEARLICASGASGISSLDPRTGQVLWSSEPFPLRTVASVVVGEGVAIASCGQGGSGGVLQRAVDLETGELKWERKRELPYVPTPIVYEGHLYVWADNGIVACANLETGETIWRERASGETSGSPVCVDGKLYCIGEQGDVTVVAAKPTFEPLGSTSLGEASHSTPAVGNGRLYLRTYSHLACLPASK
jgi:outer membrane protein assembly factor BamB